MMQSSVLPSNCLDPHRGTYSPTHVFSHESGLAKTYFRMEPVLVKPEPFKPETKPLSLKPLNFNSNHQISPSGW